MIAEPTSNSYIDYEFKLGSGSTVATYRVRAKDVTYKYSSYSNSTSANGRYIPAKGFGTDPQLYSTLDTPSEFEIHENYPNPFNPGTLITFSIPQSSSERNVELNIYDINGRIVTELLKRSLPGGNYSVRWDGRTNNSVSAPSGTYFYRLLVGGEQKTGRMLLVR